MKNLTKESILFLPGWGFNASIWDDLLESLKDYNVIKLDLPLVVKRNLFSDFNKILGNLGDNIIIIAWSFSGLFAINFCYQYPRKCKKLILLNSLPKFSTDENWLGISTQFSNHFIRRARENINYVSNKFLKLVQYPDQSESAKEYLQKNHLLLPTNHDVLVNYLEIMFGSNLIEPLSKLDRPVYFIFGEKDAIIPIKAARQLENINQNISISMIPEAGHASFVTHRNLFIKLLKNILDE